VSGDPGRSRVSSAGTAVLDQAFDIDSLYALRSAVAAHAAEAGLPRQRVYDVVTAAHERAANAIRHGVGHGRLGSGRGRGAIHWSASGQTSRTGQGAWSTTNRIALPGLPGPSRERSRLWPTDGVIALSSCAG
jgi:hypothetical protein